jgi:hypothetical protein
VLSELLLFLCFVAYLIHIVKEKEVLTQTAADQNQFSIFMIGYRISLAHNLMYYL